MSIFDNDIIEIPCPKCGQEIDEKIADLKNHSQINCSSCGVELKVENEELLKQINVAEKVIEDSGIEV